MQPSSSQMLCCNNELFKLPTIAAWQPSSSKFQQLHGNPAAWQPGWSLDNCMATQLYRTSSANHSSNQQLYGNPAVAWTTAWLPSCTALLSLSHSSKQQWFISIPNSLGMWKYTVPVESCSGLQNILWYFKERSEAIKKHPKNILLPQAYKKFVPNNRRRH